MSEPRKDSRGILDPAALFARVDFRRRMAAPELQPYVEHYWLIDWDLVAPFEQHVVPHPAINIVFQRYGDEPGIAEISGIGKGLFSIKLAGMGRVCGVQFRPGAFRTFHRRPVASLTGRRLATGTAAEIEAVLHPAAEDDRVAALNAYLASLDPLPDPAVTQAMELVEHIRRDRSLRRVPDVARQAGVSVRSLQRLFSEYVGVSPKWVLLRYRLHDAIEQAPVVVDWAVLAAELGYSDQAHLARDFTATIGMSPTAYQRAIK